MPESNIRYPSPPSRGIKSETFEYKEEILARPMCLINHHTETHAILSSIQNYMPRTYELLALPDVKDGVSSLAAPSFGRSYVRMCPTNVSVIST